MNGNKNGAIAQLIQAVLSVFSRKNEVPVMQLVRVSEQFDVVLRPPLRGGILIHRQP